MTAALIVDDDPDVRSLIGLALCDDGYDIREAADGVSALEALDDSARLHGPRRDLGRLHTTMARKAAREPVPVASSGAVPLRWRLG